MSIVSLFRCKDCNEFIFLDDTKLSRNGKKIPFDAKIPEGKRVRVPHKCSVKPFRKRYYGFRQIPDRTIKDKVEMFGYGNAPQTTYDTPRAHFHMLIGISGVANGVVQYTTIE
jgi:hypothetical protein